MELMNYGKSTTKWSKNKRRGTQYKWSICRPKQRSTNRVSTNAVSTNGVSIYTWRSTNGISTKWSFNKNILISIKWLHNYI